ncbi:MAG: TRAP transporter small permease subunit [Rhodobacteraceae bacterium]|nr:TRAP transporter small permease subunit [Paracoccaceae bacterium]
MASLARVMRAINALNRLVGNVFAWLAPVVVIACFWVVVERYLFAHTRLWLQDLYVWLNGAMFAAVAGYALYRNDHVRVDIFFRPASDRRKALLDLIGVAIFLLPFTAVAWAYCYPFVARSWRLLEPSSNPGGMPGLFVLKGFILLFAALLALQGIAMAIRSVLILARREDLVPGDFRYHYETE